MRRTIKRILCFLLICRLFLITAWAKPEWPSDTGIQAEAGIVMDMDSGAVLFGQNIHVPYPPASITKIMTALIVLEHADPQDIVEFTDNAVYSVEADSGNKINVVAGDRLSVEDCLYAMLLVSSNQAANALAEHVAGSISGFVEMMNQKLTKLGCAESHFDNPSGLNGDTQYVTAYDMALIAQAAYNNEELVKISSARSHKLAPTTNSPGGLTVRNEHRLVITDDPTSNYYFPPAVAGKTGYLIKAGNTLVTYAESESRRLVSVILKGQPRQYFLDGKELLDFGFRNFQNIEIASEEIRYVTGDEMVELESGSYKASELTVEPGRTVALPLSAVFEDAELTQEPLPEDHPADAVALLSYTYDDRAVGSAWLLAKNGITVADEGAVESSSTAHAPKDTADTELTNPFSTKETLVAILILGLIVLLAAGLAWLLYSRKKEAEAREQRRKLRRQRLQESGDEEEFDRLLSQRKEKKR